MSYFVNYEHGVSSISNDQALKARLTNMEELIEDVQLLHKENLSVSLDEYIEIEIKKIDLSAYDFDNLEEVYDFVFGEADFLELTLTKLNVDVTEFPDLRDAQHDLCRDWVAI